MGQIYRVCDHITRGKETAACLRRDKVRFLNPVVACRLCPIAFDRSFAGMRFFWIASLLACGLFGHPAVAQDKVAEGEYEGRVVDAGALSSRTSSRWTLHSTRSGGYLLRSEIIGPSDMQGKFVQVEELNEKLVPTAIGYEVYLKGQKHAFAAIKCEFVNDSIICRMRSEEGAFACKPFKHTGPFWFWVDNLFVIDLPWLTGGAANMAHLEKGKVPLSVVSVAGGGKGKDCDLSSEDEGTLEFVATESLEVAGTKVAVKHYSLRSGSEPIDLWTTESGVMIKLSYADEGLDFVLVNYKQYKKLIPELPVEPGNGKAKN